MSHQIKSSVRKIASRNPYTGELFSEIPYISDAKLEHKIQLSGEAFKKYKTLSFKERSHKLHCLAHHIEKDVKFYSELIAQELGKPIGQCEGEVKKSIEHCKFYGKNLERFLKTDRVATEARNSGVMYQPLGSIYLMVPFNFPFWLTFKSGVPMLAAGNTVLMRGSDSTPTVGDEIEKLFKKAGFDNNEFLSIHSKHDQLDKILSNKHVQGVSFTGSTNTGRNIAKSAGKNLKKAVMELGGSDPFIVSFDADLDLAVDQAIKSRLANCGQVCISAKRFIIHSQVYEQFKEKLIEKLENYVVMGDPLDPKTTVGPMARHDLKEQIHEQVEKAKQQGANLLYQHPMPENSPSQNFYPPAVLEVENIDNILFQEETFGPVFALIKVDSDSQAIEIANSSEYGLGGAIFSKDAKKAEKMALQIETGSIFINEMAKTDSRLPSGGIKSSGFGRECSSFGIKEFVNVKSFSYK